MGAAAGARGGRYLRVGGHARRRAAGGGRAARGARGRSDRAVYGHYDVQDPGDERAVDDAAVRARHPRRPAVTARRVRRQGQLPAAAARRVRDGRGRRARRPRARAGRGRRGDRRHDDVNDWVEADERGADCAIVFDAAMLDPETPALTVATRGMVFAHLTVRTGERTAHSGHLRRRGAERDARPARRRWPPCSRDPTAGCPSRCAPGSSRPRAEERAAWDALPAGADVLAEAGARPADSAAGREYYLRTTADASLDVHRLAGGDPRTIVPPVVHCDLSVRLAPGQDPPAIEARAPEPAARSAARRRRAGAQDRARLAVALRPRVGRPADRPRRARAQLRPRAGAAADGRHAADPGQLRRARDPGRRLRLRAPAGQPPRAGRVLRAREPRTRAPRRRALYEDLSALRPARP